MVPVRVRSAGTGCRHSHTPQAGTSEQLSPMSGVLDPHRESSSPCVGLEEKDAVVGGGVLDPHYDLVTSESPSLLSPSGLACQGSDLETSVRQASPGRTPPPDVCL